MKRTAIKSVLAATSLLAVAGVANAQEINIYGASAEFNFWKTAAANFLASSGPAACSSVTPWSKDGSGKNAIITGTGCSGAFLNGDTTLTIRVSNKASYDGLYAVIGSSDSKASTSGCASLYDRQMADWTDGTMTAVKVDSTTCHTITLGASDVPANAFVQTSSGALLGPLGGTATTRAFPATGVDMSSVTTAVYQPVKVPFGFFVTDNVKAKTCSSASPTPGDYCSTDTDCGKVAGSCATTSAPITNITREMATQIFAGKIANWNAFAGFDTKQMAVCYRHAGSGTHATLDLAVMNKAWGASLPTTARTSSLGGTVSLLYFNDGTGDLLNCMDNMRTAGNGAAGYADADTNLTAGTSSTIGTGNIYGPIRYNGAYPNAQNIISGVYDFFADQSLYLANSALGNGSTIPSLKPTVDAITTYINSGANLDAAGYRNFWAGSSEMKVGRLKNPFTYPYGAGK